MNEVISKVCVLRMLEVLENLNICAADHVRLYPKMASVTIKRRIPLKYTWDEFDINIYDNGEIEIWFIKNNNSIRFNTIAEVVNYICKIYDKTER